MTPEDPVDAVLRCSERCGVTAELISTAIKGCEGLDGIERAWIHDPRVRQAPAPIENQAGDTRFPLRSRGIEVGGLWVRHGTASLNEAALDEDVTHTLTRIARALSVALDAAQVTALPSGLEQLDDVVLQLDATGHILSLNQAGAEVLGLEVSEVLGRHYLAFCHPDDRAENAAIMRRASAERRPRFRGEIRLVDTRGGIRHVHWNAALHYDGARAAALVVARDITERRAAEARYRTVIQSSPDGFWVVDEATGTIVEVNPAICEMTGYLAAELVGSHISMLDALEDPEAVRERIAGIRAAGSATFETQHRHKDGPLIDVEVTAVHHDDLRGRLFVFLRNLSARKSLEARLKASAQNMSAIIANAPFGLSVWNQDGACIHANPAGAELLGATVDEILGRNFRALPSWRESGMRDKAEHVLQMAPTMAVEAIPFDAKTVTRRGRAAHLEGKMVGFDAGPQRRLLVMFQDITARHERERELRRLERLLDATSDLVWMTDAKESLVYANPAAREGLGADPDAPPRTRGWPFDLESRVRLSEVARPAALRTGQWRGPMTLRGADGRPWATSLVLLAHRRPSGEICYLSSIARDMREEAKAQAALSEALTKLAASNAALEQFAYVASHDLQEPTRVISSYLQLLQQRYGDRLDEDANTFIGYAVDGARRMREMIRGLLAFSRVGPRGAPIVGFPLKAALDDATRDLKIAIEEARPTLTCEPLPHVVGDRRQLAQVFQNLIGNALKFSGETRAQVRIYATASEGTDEVTVSVEDRGLGIPAASRESIFELFVRLHGRDAFEGSGLGLAMCRRIIERHGGRIWVSPNQPAGSHFQFTLTRYDHAVTETLLIDDGQPAHGRRP